MAFPDVIPGKTTINILGRDFIIGPPTIADWSTVVGFMRERIKNPLPDLVRELAALPVELAATIFREANAAYQKQTNLGPEDAVQFVCFNSAGAAFLTWLLIEKQYPGQLQQHEVLTHFGDLFLNDQKAFSELAAKIIAIAGMPKTGERLAAAAAADKLPPTPGSSDSAGSSARPKLAATDSPPNP